jgi:SAM-dependent methyltransferase
VFSKLWLARRFLVPEARLVCFDARHPFPLQTGGYDVAFCHDALHYLPDKVLAVAELRRVARSVLIGHAHNRLVENLSPGRPLAPVAYGELLPGAVMYDDAELASAAHEARAPRPGGRLDEAAALALAWAPEERPGPSLTRARPGARLRLNPLLDPDSLEIRWPSVRYRQEYEALSGHLRGVDLSAGEDELYRRRVLLDLPEAW